MLGKETRYTEQPFVQALAELLRESHGDAMGNFNLRPILAQVGTYSYEHLRLMLRGKRTLTMEAIEGIARVIDVSPHYFREYRLMWSAVVAQRYPKLADAMYELAVQCADENGDSPGG